jgi:Flp pilus assembly protein TadD
MQAGRNEAAKKNYQQILALQPADIGMQLNYAQLLQRMGDAGAVAVAEKALKQAPGNADAADTLGWILVQRGNIEGGLRHLREARLRSPNNGEIRYHLAFALAKLNRKAEAKEELNAALNSQPKLPMTQDLNRLKIELGL